MLWSHGKIRHLVLAKHYLSSRYGPARASHSFLLGGYYFWEFSAKCSPYSSILFLETKIGRLDFLGSALLITPGHWRLGSMWSTCFGSTHLLSCSTLTLLCGTLNFLHLCPFWKRRRVIPCASPPWYKSWKVDCISLVYRVQEPFQQPEKHRIPVLRELALWGEQSIQGSSAREVGVGEASWIF